MEVIFEIFNPRIKIFPKYCTSLKWCPLLPSTTMQKIRNIWWQVSKNISKNPSHWHLIPLNPGLTIISKSTSDDIFDGLWFGSDIIRWYKESNSKYVAPLATPSPNTHKTHTLTPPFHISGDLPATKLAFISWNFYQKS